jgi:paraquat-inducible protein B
MTLPPDPIVTPARGPRLSLAWLAPVLALAIAGGAAWRHYAAQGPAIEIVLGAASGLEAGRTPVRFRDVEVGRVEAIRFEGGLERVVATVRMSAEVEPYLTEAAQFWVVRPVVSATEVTGLETLLSGAYLAADLSAADAAPQRRFEALAAPPPTPPGAPGRRLRLRAEGGASLAPGAPVFHRGIEVGTVETRAISADGGALVFDIFVNAPHDERIGPATRFWDVSGVSLELGAQGLSLDVQSISALLRGGVAFDDVDGALTMADGDDAPFRLFGSRGAAEEAAFEDAPGDQLRLSALFEQSVRGLSAGAPVEYRGVPVGQVEALAIDAGATLDQTRVLATLRLQPRRIGLTTDDPDERLDYFERSVARGLRARLSTGNFVTGALYVELIDAPEAPPAQLDRDAQPWPRLPTAPGALDELRAQGEQLLQRLGGLPIELVFDRLIDVLENVADVTGDEGLRAAPGELTAALSAAAGLLTTLEQENAAQALAQALASAGGAAAALEQAVGSLPALAQRLDSLVQRLEQTADAYGPGSQVNSEAVAALREARAAARAVATLAQTLERRPNSLILGR